MIFYISVTVQEENECWGDHFIIKASCLEEAILLCPIKGENVYHSAIELQLENKAWRIPNLT